MKKTSVFVGPPSFDRTGEGSQKIFTGDIDDHQFIFKWESRVNLLQGDGPYVNAGSNAPGIQKGNIRTGKIFHDIRDQVSHVCLLIPDGPPVTIQVNRSFADHFMKFYTQLIVIVLHNGSHISVLRNFRGDGRVTPACYFTAPGDGVHNQVNPSQIFTFFKGLEYRHRTFHFWRIQQNLIVAADNGQEAGQSFGHRFVLGCLVMGQQNHGAFFFHGLVYFLNRFNRVLDRDISGVLRVGGEQKIIRGHPDDVQINPRRQGQRNHGPEKGFPRIFQNNIGTEKGECRNVPQLY